MSAPPGRAQKSKRRNGSSYPGPPPSSATSNSSSTSLSVNTARLKIVVRRLPPNLPEDVFWSSVNEWVTEATTTWKSYRAGKLKTRLGKENVPARAYIAFRDEDPLVQFAKAFDGHVFRDKAGNETAATVEFAPYQKTPNSEGVKKKKDARIGTIEKDEDYISFIASVNKPTEPVSIDQLLSSTQSTSQPKTTPLLEALKAEREARLNKEKEREITVRAIQQPPKRDKKEKDKDKKDKNVKGGKKTAQAAPAPSQVASLPIAPAASTSAPPKAPRAMRNHQKQMQLQQQQQQKLAQQQAPAIQASAQGGAGRRSRPVLGLGSRHFEAALSSVGGKKRAEDKKPDVSANAPPAVVTASPVTVPSILKRSSPAVETKPLQVEEPGTAAAGPPVGGPMHRDRGGRRTRGRGRGGGGSRGGVSTGGGGF